MYFLFLEVRLWPQMPKESSPGLRSSTHLPVSPASVCAQGGPTTWKALPPCATCHRHCPSEPPGSLAHLKAEQTGALLCGRVRRGAHLKQQGHRIQNEKPGASFHMTLGKLTLQSLNLPIYKIGTIIPRSQVIGRIK